MSAIGLAVSPLLPPHHPLTKTAALLSSPGWPGAFQNQYVQNTGSVAPSNSEIEGVNYGLFTAGPIEGGTVVGKSLDIYRLPKMWPGSKFRLDTSYIMPAHPASNDTDLESANLVVIDFEDSEAPSQAGARVRLARGEPQFERGKIGLGLIATNLAVGFQDSTIYQLSIEVRLGGHSASDDLGSIDTAPGFVRVLVNDIELFTYTGATLLTRGLANALSAGAGDQLAPPGIDRIQIGATANSNATAASILFGPTTLTTGPGAF